MKISYGGARRQLEQFLSTLFLPGELIEIRLIESWVSRGKKKSRVVRTAQWLQRDAIVSQYRKMTGFVRRERANVYFGVCPRPRSGDAQDDRIRSVRCLWCDIDNVTPKEAFDRWSRGAVPSPSIVVSSGSGNTDGNPALAALMGRNATNTRPTTKAGLVTCGRQVGAVVAEQ